MPRTDEGGTEDGRTGFLAAVTPRGGADGAAVREGDFERATGVVPELRLSTPGHQVSVAICAGTEFAADPRTGVVLLLHGEVHPHAPDPAKSLLERYRRVGVEALGSEDGSYAILLVNPQRDAIHVVTDRWNSRRVFHSTENGAHWLSTARTLPLHPLPSPTLDPAGVGHYLINGLPYNGRTLFQGLSALERASVHSIGPDGLRSSSYWTLELSERFSHLSEDRMRDALYDRILAAVEKRVGGERSPFLALSGGWDSGCILGAASALGVDDLRCFSYGVAEGDDRTDAAVARRIATDLGYTHSFVSGYHRAIDEVLAQNEITQGTTQLVMETDAWNSVTRLLRTDGRPPPLLVGDQGVGCVGARFSRSRADVLRSVKIRDARWVGWLRAFLDPGRFRLLADVMEEEQALILARAPTGLDLDDTRYWLYMDQYLTRLLGYREFFAGRWSRPRYPLLDHELIDFVSGVPTGARRKKRLLKEMAAERFPEVFGGPRVKDSGPSVRSWLGNRLKDRIHPTRLRIDAEPSPLDELLPPETLLALLDRVEGGWTGGRSPQLWRRARRDLKESRPGNWLGRRVRLERRGGDLAPAFLTRALFLRSFLQRRQAEATGPTGGERSQSVRLS